MTIRLQDKSANIRSSQNVVEAKMSLRSQRVVCSAVITLFLLAGCRKAPAAMPSVKAASADEFVDSVGVNVHLAYTDTLYYQNFPLILSSLESLCVRHVRDGLQTAPFSDYYNRYDQLASNGVHADLITSENQPMSVLKAAMTGMPSAIESFEGPNEADLARGAWISTLKAYMSTIYAGVKALWPSMPVYSPSLAMGYASYVDLGNVDATSNFGNLHNYFDGFNPGTGGWGANGYGSIVWNLTNVAITNPQQPVVTTETGYTNQTSVVGSVPEAIAARYMPRLLLEQWNHGITRTYLYELLSSGGQDFGLLRPDGSRKPAFTAVANLLGWLQDPGPAFKLNSLQYSLSGGNADLHSALFQQRNGKFYLALWVEEVGYDINANVPIAVTPQTVTLTVQSPAMITGMIDFEDDGGTWSRTVNNQQVLTRTITDHVTLIHIYPTWN